MKYQAATPYLAALFLVALLAFWPTYLSLSPSASSAYTHLHAMTAALWMLILVAQPALIKTRRLALHRAIGKASYFLAPLMIVGSIRLLANNRIPIAPADAYAIQTYVLYLQLSLAVLFAGLYALAVWVRRNTAFHARLMVCTALTLVDPVLIRLAFWAQPSPTWNYQWATFGLTDLALLGMIWLDRRYPPGRYAAAVGAGGLRPGADTRTVRTYRRSGMAVLRAMVRFPAAHLRHRLRPATPRGSHVACGHGRQAVAHSRIRMTTCPIFALTPRLRPTSSPTPTRLRRARSESLEFEFHTAQNGAAVDRAHAPGFGRRKGIRMRDV